MLTLDIFFADLELRKKNIHIAEFQRLLKKIEKKNIATWPKRPMKISLIFVDEKKIQKLNKEYRQKNSPTDVLSFSLHNSDFPEDPHFGEIYISLPTAQKQAEERVISLQQELNTLFVHGVLHLLGFEHKTDPGFIKMNKLEKCILKS